MTQQTQDAEQVLLAANGLQQSDLDAVLAQVAGPGIDAGDLYFQRRMTESWALEEGIVKQGSFNLDQGVGVRALAGEKTGFSYSNSIDLPALQQAAKASRSIVRSGAQVRVQPLLKQQVTGLYPVDTPLHVLTAEEKVELLKQLDAFTRSLDTRVSQVSLNLVGAWEHVLVAALDGTLATDVRPMVRCNVSVIVEQNGRRERGSYGGGGRTDYRYFLENDRAYDYAREAVRQALVNLEAVAAPAGSMPVVMAPGWSGVLLHEAVGHGLEGDFNRKGSSNYSGRIGQQVASPLCTIVDDATIAGRRGSLSVDDEGVAAQNTVLIENGILRGYMQDKLNARLMGVASTGNGRRESYAHLPMPRMTNTYMLAGESDPEEILRSVKNGIYCASLVVVRWTSPAASSCFPLARPT